MSAPELVLGLMPHDATPENHLAAGPWCFCGQEESFPHWEEKFTFALEPLRNPALAKTAVAAAQGLAVRETPLVANNLCAEAGSFPAIYWQIILFPYMIEMASQIVERTLRVQAMLAQWGEKPLRITLLPEECGFTFVDEHDFTLRGAMGSEFNHWLFSRLLERQLPPQWQVSYLSPPKAEFAAPKKINFSRKIKNRLRNWLDSWYFPKLKGMNLMDALAFSLRLRRSFNKNAYEPLDLEHQENFVSALNQIPLPKRTTDIFIKALPESLRNLRHKPLKPKTDKPRLRLVSPSATENAPLRQRIARWAAQGNALAHYQHGGIYGHAATPCAATIVEYSQNIFFTWGWISQGDAKGNFIPAPSFALSTLPSYKGGNDGLIFVGAEMSAYGRRLDSHPTPLQYVAYRQAKKTFFDLLTPEIRAKTSYRPYFPLPGTMEDAPWLLPKYPDVCLCSGPLAPQLQRCRLLVIDHPGTTMLEALASGIPFIAYWDENSWRWVPEAALMLEELRACGIWHKTPQEAAEQACHVWADPLAWWESDSVRHVRKSFCRKYALSDHKYRNIWLNLLGTL